MKKFIIAGTIIAVLASLVIGTSAVLAQPLHPNGGGSDGGSFPFGAKLMVNITYKVTNDEDSGNVGYWALDGYNKQVQVWMTSTNNCYAIAMYEGKWQTFAGA